MKNKCSFCGILNHGFLTGSKMFIEGEREITICSDCVWNCLEMMSLYHWYLQVRYDDDPLMEWADGED